MLILNIKTGYRMSLYNKIIIFSLKISSKSMKNIKMELSRKLYKYIVMFTILASLNFSKNWS